MPAHDRDSFPNHEDPLTPSDIPGLEYQGGREGDPVARFKEAFQYAATNESVVTVASRNPIGGVTTDSWGLYSMESRGILLVEYSEDCHTNNNFPYWRRGRVAVLRPDAQSGMLGYRGVDLLISYDESDVHEAQIEVSGVRTSLRQPADEQDITAPIYGTFGFAAEYETIPEEEQERGFMTILEALESLYDGQSHADLEAIEAAKRILQEKANQDRATIIPLLSEGVPRPRPDILMQIVEGALQRRFGA